jgi:hypothetical protein
MGAPTSTVRDQIALHESRMMRDPVLSLRVWGSTMEYPWRQWDNTGALTVGREPGSTVLLSHPGVSRRHATITWRGPWLWMDAVCDAQTPPDRVPLLRVDGTAHAAVQLTPGTVVDVGSVAGAVKLVAYSARTDAIRVDLGRFIGYAESAQDTVENAMYAALRRNRHLVIHAPPGAAGLSLAKYLHDASGAGTAWPFIVGNPKELADPRELVRSATCGTLVVRQENLNAAKAAALAADVESDFFRVRLVVLAKPGKDPGKLFGSTFGEQMIRIAVPPLSARRGDLTQLVTGTVAYHAQRMGATAALLTGEDFDALTRVPANTKYDDLDSLIEVLVCVRLFGNDVERAAGYLKRDATGIRKLLKRHRLTFESLAA